VDNDSEKRECITFSFLAIVVHLDIASFLIRTRLKLPARQVQRQRGNDAFQARKG
jgi:hypothetical protein